MAMACISYTSYSVSPVKSLSPAVSKLSATTSPSWATSAEGSSASVSSSALLFVAGWHSGRNATSIGSGCNTQRACRTQMPHG